MSNANDSGRKRMYQYLTPGKGPKAEPPSDFEQRAIPAEAFDVDRVFCIVGTNARDYEVAKGLSRTLVGPQSDGLVQQARFSAVSLNQEQFLEQKAKGGLLLFTSFLMSRNSRNGTRYMVRLAVLEQRFRRRFLVFGEHIERLPLWSDHLVIELRARPAGSDPKI